CRPAPEFLADDINHFWATTLGDAFEPVTATGIEDLTTVDCPGADEIVPQVTICPSTRELFYDEPAVLDLYREFGDFSLGYFYGIGWAEFALLTTASAAMPLSN
ncbi:MAG: hypothetical protein ACO3TU_10210, partial [Burkholderiaceae bacterium]